MKKKGFTLVELLAVIVILAIIAIIATPIILNVIDEAKKGATKNSVIGYLDAVEKYIINEQMNNNQITAGNYEVSSLDVKVKGTKPTSGTIQIDNKKEVTYAILCIDGKKLVYKNNQVTEESDNCTNVTMYKELILNGADPVIKSDLVPVNISSDGVVTKANTSEKWYSYENKEWANAVILINEKDYNEGEEIEQDNIKQYYVWIPKYSYILWNVNSDNTNKVEQAIDIAFGNEAKTTGTNNGDSYIHPAFTNFNTNGIWVGKFETSYNEKSFTDNTTFLTSNPNSSSAIKGEEIIIKPNVRSLTNKKISELYTMSREVNSNLNSHMMTNVEWGAVAYLTYSKYGKCTDSGCEEIYLNNVNTGYVGQSSLFSDQKEYSATITGCSAESISAPVSSNNKTCKSNYAWNETSNKASTTGNITGIYDMSGGNAEQMMSVMKDNKGNVYIGMDEKENSGFNGLFGCPTCSGNATTSVELKNGINLPSDKRYYDLYDYTYDLGTDIWWDVRTGKLGDATKEIANSKSSWQNYSISEWYSDLAYYPTAKISWFVRGGNFDHAEGSGIFSFVRSTGTSEKSNSFRIVLAY